MGNDRIEGLLDTLQDRVDEQGRVIEALEQRLTDLRNENNATYQYCAQIARAHNALCDVLMELDSGRTWDSKEVENLVDTARIPHTNSAEIGGVYDGIRGNGIVKEEPNALGISDGELQDLADVINGTQEAQGGLTGQTIIRYKEKSFAINLCSCGSRNISFRGKHLVWLECDNCGNKSAIFDDHPEDCVSSWNALGAKLSHASADAFWKYWRENGETHKHGYYEATWGGIRAAIAHGEQEAQDESQDSAYVSDASRCEDGREGRAPQDAESGTKDGHREICVDDEAVNAQLEALRENLKWSNVHTLSQDRGGVGCFRGFLSHTTLNSIESMVRPILEEWTQKVADYRNEAMYRKKKCIAERKRADRLEAEVHRLSHPHADVTVREWARQAKAIGGADAQALEGALAMTERERDRWHNEMLDAIAVKNHAPDAPSALSMALADRDAERQRAEKAEAEVARLREAICETLDEITHNPEMSHVRVILKRALAESEGDNV